MHIHLLYFLHKVPIDILKLTLKCNIQPTLVKTNVVWFFQNGSQFIWRFFGWVGILSLIFFFNSNFNTKFQIQDFLGPIDKLDLVLCQ